MVLGLGHARLDLGQLHLLEVPFENLNYCSRLFEMQ